MPTLKLTLAYEGSAYVGWQRQPNGPSIQGCLESALGEIEKCAVPVVGAGRTDAGVHALAQVAGVRLVQDIGPTALVRAVNARLPADIRVISADVVADTFHAQREAVAKTYRYRILHSVLSSPFRRRYGWQVVEPLDHGLMAKAACGLVGEHDFAAFQATGSSVKTTVRRLWTVRVDGPAADPGAVDEGLGGDVTTVEVRGNGFLRHMVRIIVGTLTEVGRGHRGIEDVERALKTGDRSDAGQTAPPQGLFLVKVDYASVPPVAPG